MKSFLFSSRHRYWHAASAMACGVLAALLCCATAFAHAHYDHSTPAIGEVLPTPPARVDIYTDSDMAKIAGKNVIEVTNSAGQRVDDGNTILDDADRRHLYVQLQPSLPPGRYVVSFQTLSDVDGELDHGRFSFYVGRGPTAQEKKLDTQLTQTEQAAKSGSNKQQTALITVAGAIVVLAVVASVVALRRRRG
jgi:methionine-rich copper-binding protein CopC